MVRKYIAEIVGTLGLTFSVTCAVLNAGSLPGVAITLGTTVMVLIYAFGRVSGAHFNPAVTFGMVLAGRMKPAEGAGYWAAQCVGGVLGALLLKAIFPAATGLGETMPAGSEMQSLIMEIVLTFFLVLVVLRVADGPKEIGLLAGIAVGSILAADVLMGGNTSGASMNPARSLGPALVLMKFEHFWIYIVGPLAGAGVAVVLDKVMDGNKPQTA
jgi:aquaporin NIP